MSFDCLESLKECLASIDKQSGVRFEIIVLDNASKDGTRDFLKTYQTKSILSDKNIGFGAGVNRAAEIATGKYLFIANPDIVLPENALRYLCEKAEKLGEFGLISPLLVHPDGSMQLSARNYPGRLDFLFGRGSPLFKLGLSAEKSAGYLIPTGEDPVQVPAISATAIFIVKELFVRLGGFDKRFFMYLEDLDLCRRLRDRGLSIWLLPSLRVVHSWRKSSQTRPYFALYCHHLSVYRYFRKYFPAQWFNNSLLGVALVIGFIVSSLLKMTGKGIRN